MTTQDSQSKQDSLIDCTECVTEEGSPPCPNCPLFKKDDQETDHQKLSQS